jgi:SAM-dependent methyltransferase
LGAGYGGFINEVKAEERWAADLWPGLQKNLQDSVRGVVGDITLELSGIPKNHFSLCFMSNVLEHFYVEDAEKILSHVDRYLEPSGHLVILQPNFTYCSKKYFDDYTHRTIFTAEGICNFLLDHGFSIELALPRYLPFSFKSRLPRPTWAVALYLRLPWKPLAAQMLVIAKKKGSPHA